MQVRCFTGLFVFALGCSLSGCVDPVATRGLPSWVLTPETAYSGDRYLMAVGEGDSLAAAEAHALNRMAGRFQTQVQSRQQLKDHVQERFGREHEFDRQSDYQSNISLQTDQTLLNTKTAEQFIDATGRVYVLVVLDRLETARLYDQALVANAERIGSLAEAHPSQLVAYARARQALDLGLKNEMLLRQLAIIHAASANQVRLPYKLEQLRMQSALTTAAVRFDVSLAGARSKPLEQQIRSLMTGYGFKADPRCDLCVSGTLFMETIDFLRKDLRTVRYRVLVDVKDTNGKTLVAMQKEGRESHITEQEAFLRAERTVHLLVEQELLDRLTVLTEKLAGN